jgi:hypothetical protein
MSKTILRWWLWVSLTLVVAAVAGLKGFYSALWHYDVTYLSFACLALYGLATGSIGWKLWQGADGLAFEEHILDSLPYVGILGLFIGLAYGLDALRVAGLTQESVSALLNGLSTKMLSSIAAMVAYLALGTQLKILDMR